MTATVTRHVYRAPQPRRRRKSPYKRFLRRLRRLLLLLVLVCLAVSAGRLFTLVASPVSEFLAAPFAQKRQALSVEYLGQGNYPTGCESVTAVMALRHAGFSVSVDEFIDYYLPKGEYYTDTDGTVWGDDPNLCFVGDPRSSDGFGCYAPVIYRALCQTAGAERVADLTGASLQELCEDYISQDIPVILWATINMQEPYQGRSWQLLGTGETFTWTAREHCLLLVGYDGDCYYFNDPYRDKGLTAYEKELVEARYEQLGCQALALLPA